MFRARPKVTCAEDHGCETSDVLRGERCSAGESHLDRLSAGAMKAREARRQCHRIVRDDEVEAPQAFGERSARRVRDAPVRVDHQEPRVGATLQRRIGGDHATPAKSRCSAGCA